MTKSFLVVAAIFILVGGGIGGAFTGGVILGRNQAENEAPAVANYVQSQDFSQQEAVALRLQQLAGEFPAAGQGRDSSALRERFGGDAATPASPMETPAAPDNAIASAGVDGQAGFGRGIFGGVPPTFGTIDSIGEDILVINTPQGPVEAAISPETVIQVFSAGALTDLEEGMSVTVMGQEDAESGKLEAVSIIASPEGAGGFPGFGGFQNRTQGGGRP